MEGSLTDKDIERRKWEREPHIGPIEEDGAAGPSTPHAATGPDSIPFEFRGNAREYFKIWIVNLALTLATVGIYSPWAKVRNLRYFYGNTYLDGSSFEFLGKPVAILKGRLIAVAAFGCYWLAANFYPAANLVLLPLFAVLFPWVMVKALSFRSRSSAYRNLTFTYRGSYRQIAAAYLGLPLLVVGALVAVVYLSGIPFNMPGHAPVRLSPEDGRKVTMLFGGVVLGASLLFPYFYYLQKRAYAAPRGFGDTAFSFDAAPRDFYRLLLKLSLFSVVAIVVVLVVMGMAGAFSKGNTQAPSHGLMFVSFMSLLGFALFQLLLFVAFITWTRNLVLSAVRIGEAQVASRLRVGAVFLLYVTNIIAVICTLGLLIPWAKVRLTRYQMSRTGLVAPHGTENFTGSPGASASAVGEELADIFDMDLGI